MNRRDAEAMRKISLRFSLRFCGLILILAVQFFTHLAWLPISAHSGQVAIPYMMNRGMGLFDTLLEQHAPGSSLIAAAAQRLLPYEPIVTARLLNALLVMAITALVYVVARHIADGNVTAGLAAVLVWFWWEPVFVNVMFYFNTLLGFGVLLAVTARLTLDKRLPDWLLALLCGLILGAATLAKQHGWAAVILFGAWMLLPPRAKLHEWVAFIVGALMFPALLALVYAGQGLLDSYIYWNWTFNVTVSMDNPPYTGDLIRKLALAGLFVPPFLLMMVKPPGDIQRREWMLVALMGLALCATLIPRAGEIAAAAALPLVAVMTGAVVGRVVQAIGTPLDWLKRASVTELTLVGVLIAALAGWGWTGAVVYAPHALGRAATPAYDEFKPLLPVIAAHSQPGDTLFVLPETDSTPQLHAMTGLLPPGVWVKGWFWYLRAPEMTDRILSEWESTPPTLLVYFPDLIQEGMPDIAPLVEFMRARCQRVGVVEDILYHGAAEVWRVE